jgi:hypothetical protein
MVRIHRPIVFTLFAGEPKHKTQEDLVCLHQQGSFIRCACTASSYLFKKTYFVVFKAALRIRDILIRIRIRGSVPQINGFRTDSGSCYFFFSDLQDGNNKKFIDFLLITVLFEATFTSFSRIKNHEVSKQ